MAAHSEEFASRGQKYQTCLILSARPREAYFRRIAHQNFFLPAHVRKRLSKPLSMLSSFLTVCCGLYLKELHLLKGLGQAVLGKFVQFC